MSVSTVLERDAGAAAPDEPLINLVPARLCEHLGTAVLTVCGQRVPVPGLLLRRPSLRRFLDRPIVVGSAPSTCRTPLSGGPPARGRWSWCCTAWSGGSARRAGHRAGASSIWT
jgi:hypothetical protein